MEYDAKYVGAFEYNYYPECDVCRKGEVAHIHSSEKFIGALRV